MNPSSLLNKQSPNFNLESNKGKISLKNFLGKKIILYFYPKDNTPGCTIEANDFTKLSSEFKKLNTEIIGVSKDDIKSHERFISGNNLKLVLASDSDHKMQKDYGVWQKKKFIGREFMGTVRTTFLIDEKGKIIYVWENVKALGHARKVLEEVKKL